MFIGMLGYANVESTGPGRIFIEWLNACDIKFFCLVLPKLWSVNCMPTFKSWKAAWSWPGSTMDSYGMLAVGACTTHTHMYIQGLVTAFI